MALVVKQREEIESANAQRRRNEMTFDLRGEVLTPDLMTQVRRQASPSTGTNFATIRPPLADRGDPTA
ncbi:MAG: hypothetical protein ACK4JY_03675 [Brevundimonas sp.]|uniref:hypothetical protein n=1 Tax=Brevundimonas sp. TaxID=1871086 RepID=UPI00391C47AE